MPRIQVWDIPTRLVHWVLVVLVFFSWGSAEYGQMELHRYSGYTVFGVLVFRLYWGFAGSYTARFANFVRGPRAVIDYVRASTSPPAFGHNPLGAISVVLLLMLLIAQVTLGLFAVDIDGLESGSLSRFVSFDTGRAFAEWHETVFNVLLAFIVLHVAAILYYLIRKRENLIAPMISGKRSASGDAPPVTASPLHFVIGIALAALCVWLIV